MTLVTGLGHGMHTSERIKHERHEHVIEPERIKTVAPDLLRVDLVRPLARQAHAREPAAAGGPHRRTVPANAQPLAPASMRRRFLVPNHRFRRGRPSHQHITRKPGNRARNGSDALRKRSNPNGPERNTSFLKRVPCVRIASGALTFRVISTGEACSSSSFPFF